MSNGTLENWYYFDGQISRKATVREVKLETDREGGYTLAYRVQLGSFNRDFGTLKAAQAYLRAHKYSKGA